MTNLLFELGFRLRCFHCLHPRPAKLGRVKTSRFTRTTKMRHPSTYDDAKCATRDAVTNIHVYQY